MKKSASTERFVESLRLLADEAETRYVEKWVDAYLDRGYKQAFELHPIVKPASGVN